MAVDQGKRAAVYIDGFNLYHPIKEMNEDFLKWNNLWGLSLRLCDKQGLELVKVAFCTAVPDHLPHSKSRHVAFNRVQEQKGVMVIKGHHVYDQDAGKYSEKQSDINVALELILDGCDDIYDVAYLISADSDQAATARKFRERFGSSKKLYSVAPPNKKPPEKMRPFVDRAFSLTKHDIECVIMNHVEFGTSGKPVRMPVEYTRPNWWVHPNDRPKKKS